MSEYTQLPLFEQPHSDRFKICTKCGVKKPLSDFTPQKAGKFGVTSRCKQCGAEYQKRWRNNLMQNPEKYEAYKVKDRANHNEQYWQDPEKARERNRQSRINHPEWYKEYDRRKIKRQKERDPEGFREKQRLYSRRHHEQNREYYRRRSRVANMSQDAVRRKREREKQWREKNRHKVIAKNEKRRAEKQNAPGSHTPEEIQQLYQESGDRCFYCGVELNGKYHVDHVIPMSRGGSNSIDNLVITCATCNSSKANLLLEEWDGPPALRNQRSLE